MEDYVLPRLPVNRSCVGEQFQCHTYNENHHTDRTLQNVNALISYCRRKADPKQCNFMKTLRVVTWNMVFNSDNKHKHIHEFSVRKSEPKIPVSDFSAFIYLFLLLCVSKCILGAHFHAVFGNFSNNCKKKIDLTFGWKWCHWGTQCHAPLSQCSYAVSLFLLQRDPWRALCPWGRVILFLRGGWTRVAVTPLWTWFSGSTKWRETGRCGLMISPCQPDARYSTVHRAGTHKYHTSHTHCDLLFQ